MKRNKAMLAALIGATCLATISGCGKVNGSAEAMTVNGEAVSVGSANFLLRSEEAQTSYMMTSWGLAQAGYLWDSVTDEETGETYGETFKEGEAEQIQNMVLLRQNTEEYKVELSEEELAEIDTVAQTTYDNNKEALDQMGTSKDNVAEILQLKNIQMKMEKAMKEDTDREVSDEEAMQTTISYARIDLSPAGEDGNPVEMTDDEKAEAKEQLESLLTKLKAAGNSATIDISEVANEEEDSPFYCASMSWDTNPAEDAEGDGIEQSIKDAVKDLSDGEYCDKVIEADDYLYIVRLDTRNDAEKTAEKKESIITEREQENYQNKLDALREESTIEIKKGWEDLKVTDKDTYTIAVPQEEEVEDAAAEEVEAAEEEATDEVEETEE